ncbi:hypothetical protein MRX96_002748 [Rhipicephalus microplus]
MEATQLRAQLEQLLQSQPPVVEKLSQSIQTEAESPPEPIPCKLAYFYFSWLLDGSLRCVITWVWQSEDG